MFTPGPLHMNVCIVGCGALGGIFGAHLAMHENVTVWAYDRNESHVRALNENGLTLAGRKQYRAVVHATIDPSCIPPCDIGIVVTKFANTREAIADTAHLLRNGIVCSMQNGVGNEEIMGEYVDRILSGTTMLGGHIVRPGSIDFDTDGTTWIGPASKQATLEDARTLTDLLNDKGIESHAVPDPRGIKWSKLIFNSAANGLCALTGLTFGRMYQQPELRELMYGIAREGITVAKALGISLHSDPLDMLNKAALKAYDHAPSMLIDVRHLKPTEVGALNGGIVQFATRLQIPCPLNRTIVALIGGLETSWEID
ncbi:ketopantoate reductase family protein [Parahaliea mediterranea]|uniref:ketopantoate reductase family protein n=1 Tax=Parahaliea mediterranea TaxID=651086 RepID=UPI000E2EA4EA|nr:ketopantoate reductase family protein [Parahaliea mediterranea]